MARTIQAVFETNWAGAKAKETMEFSDDATDEEIEEAVRDWASNYYSFSWGEADAGPRNKKE